MICIALWCNILELAVEYVPLNAVDFGTQHHDTRFLLQNLDTYITCLWPFSLTCVQKVGWSLSVLVFKVMEHDPI